MQFHSSRETSLTRLSYEEEEELEDSEWNQRTFNVNILNNYQPRVNNIISQNFIISNGI